MGIFFGTDGIRGVAGQDLTIEMAFKVGKTLSCLKHKPKIIIAKDTRESGDCLKSSFVSGAISRGAIVHDIGLAPTPCVSYLVKQKCFDFGVMISASHNSHEFNGIKIFGADGKKIDDALENQIEKFLFIKKGETDFGIYEFHSEYIADYVNHVKSFFCENCLCGIKVVLDSANGASSNIAERLYSDLGAIVHAINTKTTGKDINNGCGALFCSGLQEKVLETGADVGFAFDGDADRVIAVDDMGEEFDGDQILCFLAKQFAGEGLLDGNTVVATIQTNLGIENNLKNVGIEMLRSDVGDKYVIKLMGEIGAVLGGEQSGHIIIRNVLETGDGMLAGLFVAKYLAKSKEKLSNLRCKELIPQHTRNIVVKDKSRIMESTILKEAKTKAEQKLIDGRLILRMSGTEPKIRIMIESKDEQKSKEIIEELSIVIEHIDKFE